MERHAVIIISGPSGTGKTHTIDALTETIPLGRDCLIWTSRKPRINKGEKNGVSFFFSSQESIMALPSESFLTGKVHNDRQAVDLLRMMGSIHKHTNIIQDMFHTFVPELKSFLESNGVVPITIFLSPMERLEYTSLANHPDKIKEIIRENIHKRDPNKKVDPARMESAIEELQEAFDLKQDLYDHVFKGVPEYIWDKEKDSKNPKNIEIRKLLQRINQVIKTKASWI